MVFVILVLAVIAATCVGVQWWSSRPRISNELPPLVIPLTPNAPGTTRSWYPEPPSSRANASAAQPAHAAPQVPSATLQPTPQPAAASKPQRDPDQTYAPRKTKAPDIQPAPVISREVQKAQPPLELVVQDFADLNDPAPSETVRFRRPGDEPVQLLPGRLEVVSGDPRRQDIRFVRVPGRPAELILGREPGDSAQHVTLRSNTVSRQHARFVYADGRWVVANLSQTNPVVLNDAELSARDGARDLADGDRLELGEVVLRFHAR